MEGSVIEARWVRGPARLSPMEDLGQAQMGETEAWGCGSKKGETPMVSRCAMENWAGAPLALEHPPVLVGSGSAQVVKARV